MATTIYQVAEVAGVSTSTVSRVFSTPDQVSAATRRSVLTAAQELGYAPSRSHRSGTGGATGLLGLFIPDLRNPFYTPLVDALTLTGRQHNYLSVLANSDGYAINEGDLVAAMATRCDGLILHASALPADRLQKLSSTIPTVLVNRRVDEVPAVVSSTTNGLRQVVEHLHSLGHRTCCYTMTGPQSQTLSQRQEDLRSACQSAGVDLIEIGPYESTFDAGVHAADVAIARGATAIIGQNDVVAAGAIRQLNSRGLRVPGDMSVVGIDDTILATTITPALTTIRIPVTALATHAVRLLIDLIQAQAPAETSYELSTQLIVRDSTGPAPDPAAAHQ